MRRTGNIGAWSSEHIDMFWKLAARKYRLEHISPARVREAFAMMARPEAGIAYEGRVRIDLDKRYEQIRADFPNRTRCTVYTVYRSVISSDLSTKSKADEVVVGIAKPLPVSDRAVTGQRPPVASSKSKRGRKPKNDNSRPGGS